MIDRQWFLALSFELTVDRKQVLECNASVHRTAIKPVTARCFKALSQSEKFARTLLRHTCGKERHVCAFVGYARYKTQEMLPIEFTGVLRRQRRQNKPRMNFFGLLIIPGDFS